MLVDYYRLSDLRYIHTRVCLCKLCVGVRHIKELNKVRDLFGITFLERIYDLVSKYFLNWISILKGSMFLEKH